MKLFKLTVLTILIAFFSILINLNFDNLNGHLKIGSSVYASGSTVVNAPYYDTSGNGGRKIIQLPNGWLIATLTIGNNNTSTCNIYKSVDNGSTWTQLCYVSGIPGYIPGAAITNINNICTLVFVGSSTVNSVTFDVTTVSNSNLFYTKKVIDTQSEVYGNLSIANDGTNLYVAWCSINDIYYNSKNIRYSQSIDGGNTWSVPSQVTTCNDYRVGISAPCIVINNNRQPIIFAQVFNQLGLTVNAISSFNNFNGTWNEKCFYVSTNGPQFNPCAIVKKYGSNVGRIWVAWQGWDATDTTYNIRVSYSDDNGKTWSSMQKITSGNKVQRQNVTLSEDHFGNLYAIYDDNSNIVYQKCNNGSTTFAGANLLEYSGTNPSAIEYENNGVLSFIWQTQSCIPCDIILTNNQPSMEINSSLQNNVFSATNEFNSILVTGSIKDIDLGDVETAYYRIDGITGQAGTRFGSTVTANGSNQTFSNSIDIGSQTEGSHTLYVWVQDICGSKSAEMAIPFKMDKTAPAGSPPTFKTNSPIQLTVIPANVSDPTSNGVSSGLNSYLFNKNGSDIGSWTSNPTFTDNGLTPNTQYTYKYKVTDKVGNTSDYSQTASIYTLANQPADLKVTGGDGDSIKLSWSANNNPNGTEYCIAAFDSTGKIIKQNAWTAQLTDTITGLNALDSYIIKVKARNGDKVETDWYEVETSQAIIDTIKADPHGTYITFSWAGLPGATGYDVESDGQVLSIGNKTSYTMKDLKLGTQHTFRVRGKNFGKIGQWSTLQTAMTTAVLPGKPLNLTYTVTNTAATINWDAVTDAETYEISEIIPGQEEEITDNSNVTTCELRGLAPTSTHTYKIRAVNSIGDGEWSDPITITTFLLDTPLNIITTESDTSIVLTWNQVKDATSYVIEVNGTETIADSNSYTFKDLSPESKYTFRIKSVGNQGQSGYSDPISTATTPIKPAIPQNVHAVVSDTTITVRWDKVDSSEGYDVELDGIVMENDNVSIYIHDGLESDTMHTYKVRARNSAIEGDWSELQYIKTLPGKPDVPKNIEIRSTTTGATLTWQGKDSDLSYDIKIYDGTKKEDGTPTDPVIIENIAKKTYTHRRTSLGQEYTYWIRTRNKEGVSDWSGKIINNAIKAKCTKNKTVDLGLTAKDVTDFSAYTMVVTYNASAVDVIDLSTLTGQYETVPGRIEGTDIEITDFTPGKITFKCDKVVNPGEAWTGVINSIKFKAKATGGTTITYTVLCKSGEIVD